MYACMPVCFFDVCVPISVPTYTNTPYPTTQRQQVTHKKRQGKKKVSLELFRCREPGIALEMVEIEPAPVRVCFII